MGVSLFQQALKGCLLWHKMALDAKLEHQLITRVFQLLTVSVTLRVVLDSAKVDVPGHGEKAALCQHFSMQVLQMWATFSPRLFTKTIPSPPKAIDWSLSDLQAVHNSNVELLCDCHADCLALLDSWCDWMGLLHLWHMDSNLPRLPWRHKLEDRGTSERPSLGGGAFTSPPKSPVDQESGIRPCQELYEVQASFCSNIGIVVCVVLLICALAACLMKCQWQQQADAHCIRS